MKKTTAKKKTTTKKTTGAPKKKTTSKVTATTSAKKSVKNAAKKAVKKTETKLAKSVAKKTTKKAKSAVAKTTQKAPKKVQESAEAQAYALPQLGQTAPSFEAHLSSGETFRLSDIKGKKHLVLYFYPKDDTPGCTKESCAFETKRKTFESHDVMILGVSPDDVRSHQKFKTKYGLNFELIADVDHSVSQAYGVWALKSMYGKTYWGVQRSTFLIDKEGLVRHIWPKVSVDGHDEEVEQAIRDL